MVLGPMRPGQSEMLSAALRTSSEVHFARDFENQAQLHLDRSPSFVTRANLGTALATLNVLRASVGTFPRCPAPRPVQYPEITGQRGRWERGLARRAHRCVRWRPQRGQCRGGRGGHRIVGRSRGGCVIWGAVADRTTLT